MSKTLDEWFAARDMIVRNYEKYLDRNVINDPDALTNWLHHWREGNYDQQWFIDRIMESEEYKTKHAGTLTPPPPTIFVPGNRKTATIATGVNPIGMSYWRNINAHGNNDFLRIILSIHDELVVFTIDKRTLEIKDRKNLGINHTGEGVFFSVSKPDIIYIPYDDRLEWFDIITSQHDSIFTNQGYRIWQLHCDYIEKTWSMTLKDKNYNIVGWGVWENEYLSVFDIKGSPDECQIDKSGKWLVIKENNYNRLIHLPSRAERIIENQAGAFGHSDCGFGCMLGENDYSPRPGALDLIKFHNAESENIFSTGIWNMGYVSFTNAQDIPAEKQRCLVTTPIELISVRLDGSGGDVICPNLTESQEYEHRPKANLCPLGQYAVWTAFVNGSLNCYVVQI